MPPPTARTGIRHPSPSRLRSRLSPSPCGTSPPRSGTLRPRRLRACGLRPPPKASGCLPAPAEATGHPTNPHLLQVRIRQSQSSVVIPDRRHGTRPRPGPRMPAVGTGRPSLLTRRHRRPRNNRAIRRAPGDTGRRNLRRSADADGPPNPRNPKSHVVVGGLRNPKNPRSRAVAAMLRKRVASRSPTCWDVSREILQSPRSPVAAAAGAARTDFLRISSPCAKVSNLTAQGTAGSAPVGLAC